MEEVEVFADHIHVDISKKCSAEFLTNQFRMCVDVRHRSVPFRYPEKSERTFRLRQPSACGQFFQRAGDVKNCARAARVVVGGFFRMVEVSTEDKFFVGVFGPADMRNNDIHEIWFKPDSFHLPAHHNFFPGKKHIAELCSLPAGKVKTERYPAQFISPRPHAGVLKHIGMFLCPVIVEKTDDRFRAVLKHRKAVDGAAVPRCEHNLSFHVFFNVIFIPFSAANPHKLGRNIAGVGIRHHAHRNFGIAHNPFVVGLDHPQLCP